MAVATVANTDGGCNHCQILYTPHFTFDHYQKIVVQTINLTVTDGELVNADFGTAMQTTSSLVNSTLKL